MKTASGYALGLVFCLISCQVSAQKPSGLGQGEVAPFDAEIVSSPKKYDVPGGAIAVARNGSLVVSRGYGTADRDSGRAVVPFTPFRIASLTKPLVAIAALVLVDKGRLSLDQPMAPMLRARMPVLLPAEGRLAKITIRYLLQHTAGSGAAARTREVAGVSWMKSRSSSRWRKATFATISCVSRRRGPCLRPRSQVRITLTRHLAIAPSGRRSRPPRASR